MRDLQTHPIFFRGSSIEEVQDPGSSPRREEVGRRTLRDYGGFLLPIFLSGEVSRSSRGISGVSKTITQKPPDTREY
jgi:hypothetical protein